MKKIEMEVICENGDESEIDDSMREAAQENRGMVIKSTITDVELIAVPKGNAQ